jgi:hypothetical protein
VSWWSKVLFLDSLLLPAACRIHFTLINHARSNMKGDATALATIQLQFGSTVSVQAMEYGFLLGSMVDMEQILHAPLSP